MIKREKNELMRIQTVLEKDRLNVGKGFNELLSCDLNKLLKDYFDFSNDASVEITKGKGGYKLFIELDIIRVKGLNASPKEN